MTPIQSSLVGLALATSAISFLSFSAAAESFSGPWSRGDGNVRVNVAPCGGKMCMTNTWVKPGVTDEKVGEKVVFDVKPQSDGNLKGSGFDPQRKLTFSVNIKVSGDSMTTSGCGLGGMVCKSENWTRTK